MVSTTGPTPGTPFGLVNRVRLWTSGVDTNIILGSDYATTIVAQNNRPQYKGNYSMISYPGAPFCATGSAVTPTVSALSIGTVASSSFSISPASGLPINATTGSITIAGATPGTYTVNYTFTNNNGCTNTATANVTINGLTPVITAQPAGATVCQNATAPVLSATATGIGLTYQWYRNTTNSNVGGTLITGATTSSYSAPITSVGTLYYYVVIKTSCSTTGVSSNVAAVSVTAKPTAVLNYGTGSFCKIVGTASPTISSIVGGPLTTISYSSSPAGLSISSTTGVVNLSASTVGTYTVTYTFSSSSGCTNTAVASITVLAIPANPSAITGSTSTTVNGTIALSSSPTGGVWSSSNTSIATVSTTGLVTGKAIGTAIINYKLYNGVCYSTTPASRTITVGAAAAKLTVIAENDQLQSIKLDDKSTSTEGLEQIKVYPNPSRGEFNLVVPENIPAATLKVISLKGVCVQTTKLNAGKNRIQINDPVSGQYYLSIIAENQTKVIPIVIIK